jgi:epoxide hydrolase-like predicted phosphatase
VSEPGLNVLIVDWGGVLTTGLGESMAAWAVDDGIDYPRFEAVMREWLGPAAALEARFNPVHALERGEIEVPDFEAHLAERLLAEAGWAPPEEGIVERMFARFEHAPDMSGLVRRAHETGLRTALLSNSWGNTYPRDGWDEMFDAVVISGEVGMRKPEPRIYRHTAALLGAQPADCVFVDDLPINVAGAVEVGMVGVLHTDYDATADELEVLFDRRLRT